MGRIKVQGQASKTFKRPHLNQWLGVVLHTCLPSQGNTNKIAIQVSLGIKLDVS
jgi:hypothetical protein